MINQTIEQAGGRVGKLVILFLVIITLNYCTLPEVEQESYLETKQKLIDELSDIDSLDSLNLYLNDFIGQKNDFGKMICFNRQGIIFRRESRFFDAINSHKEGLKIALELHDTIEIMQTLNNIGTNYRRIGANSEASQFYYKALHYSEIWSGYNTDEGIKNRAVSLNGLGNAILTLGYYNDAEKHFREALRGQIALGSALGQAINYANLGAIFEKRSQYDSAYVYYNKSLDQNKIARSKLGIGLSFINLGNLYEKQNKLDCAKCEFEKAYDLMYNISDKWHWLESGIALSRIYLTIGDFDKYDSLLVLAENTANEIKSKEHLAEIYLLKYEYELKQGNYKLALDYYKRHKNMQDSIQGIQKSNSYMDTRLAYENEKNLIRLHEMEQEDEIDKGKKKFVIYVSVSVIIALLFIVAFLYYIYFQGNRTSNSILEK